MSALDAVVRAGVAGIIEQVLVIAAVETDSGVCAAGLASIEALYART